MSDSDASSPPDSFDPRTLGLGGRVKLKDLQRRHVVEGKGVRPRWWQRFRSLLLLPILVVSLGIALAAAIGIVAALMLLATRGLSG